MLRCFKLSERVSREKRKKHNSFTTDSQTFKDSKRKRSILQRSLLTMFTIKFLATILGIGALCSASILANISISPQTIRKRIGASVSFLCQVEGLKNPVIHWYYIIEGERPELHIDGNRLTIENLRPEDSGDYTCAVYTTTGLMIANAKLTVEHEDSGDYTCAVYTTTGLMIANAKLTVEHESIQNPQNPDAMNSSLAWSASLLANISISPQTIRKRIGASVSFLCQVEGLKNPEIHWYYSIEGELPELHVNGNRLTIENLRPEDSGDYTCAVYTTTGLMIANAKLTVEHESIQNPQNPDAMNSSLAWSDSGTEQDGNNEDRNNQDRHGRDGNGGPSMKKSVLHFIIMALMITFGMFIFRV
ncbi:hypothetical protein PoB_003466800 [Plakobranchus ocellatus]|uniref:Ig-like domain-containing protein n=1 Tax=Plakobranchus ocellatus TaxID=259542 RepID=A0AAV4AMZ1_9GAST|nr:hypothetical protein PoB_003466800 [Plakobranchus ocellatus]